MRLTRQLFTLALAALPALLAAQPVVYAGRLGPKALLVIDGRTHTLAVGERAQGVRLTRLSPEEATVEREGQAWTLLLGGTARLEATPDAPSSGTLVLTVSQGGHFRASGSINGRSTQFLVDTGATMVTLSQADATRLGIDFIKGKPGRATTAGGVVPVHQVTLDSLRIGDVVVHQVTALVIPSPMPFVLLGNSFLSRFQMTRHNDTLTLVRRY